MPVIVGLFRVAKINEKELNEARLEKYPTNPEKWDAFRFSVGKTERQNMGTFLAVCDLSCSPISAFSAWPGSTGGGSLEPVVSVWGANNKTGPPPPPPPGGLRRFTKTLPRRYTAERVLTLAHHFSRPRWPMSRPGFLKRIFLYQLKLFLE